MAKRNNGRRTGYYLPELKELDDPSIMLSIYRAADLYRDGCIVEARQILESIARSIRRFEKENEKIS